MVANMKYTNCIRLYLTDTEVGHDLLLYVLLQEKVALLINPYNYNCN